MRNTIVAVLLLTLYACGSNRSYYHYEHIDNDGWRHNDTITFCIPPQTAGTYHAALCMRTTKVFPYSSITLRMITSILPTNVQKTEKVWCYVYDKEGNPHGKTGVSSSEISFPLKDIQLNVNDSVTIKIHHCMKRESIPGITDIGISLTAE